jgi:outer membrane biosynthesis protein TonB
VPTHRIISVLALAFTGLASLTGTFGSDLWNDRPLRIVQTTQVNFPVALAAEGVSEGEVRVVLNVDSDGKLVDYLVTGYTRRELADEWVAHVRAWSFEPALNRGEPVGTRGEVVFTFQARGMVLSLTPMDTLALSTNRLISPTLTSLLCRPSELDEPVRPLSVVEPQHPGNHVSPPPSQPRVLIDFYVDMEGRPRMPVVLRAPHELYASAAVKALMQWRFNPPSRHGQPVIVRATQLFSFAERGR